MSFKPLDPEITRKLLQKEVDILTPAAQERNNLYQDLTCPCCGSMSLGAELNKASLNELVPRYFFQCTECACKFDPHTSLIHQDGVVPTSMTEVAPEDLHITHSADPKTKNRSNGK